MIIVMFEVIVMIIVIVVRQKPEAFVWTPVLLCGGQRRWEAGRLALRNNDVDDNDNDDDDDDDDDNDNDDDDEDDDDDDNRAEGL